MRDGYTRRLDRAESDQKSFEEYARRWAASLTIVSGGAEGSEYLIERPELTIGRGPEADLSFDDRTMSREHAVIEFAGAGYRVRDLASMNGVFLNGSEVKVGDLKSGDRIQVGQHVFQFVLEKSQRSRTYVLSEDA
jgi:pSer/pThr/pTyr-binding forkhead associated (FHA) protein